MHNIDDFRAAARRRLPRGLFDYIDRGAEDDLAVHHNRRAFERLKLRPRVLAGAGDRRLETHLLGRSQALPFGIAPTGPASFLWHHGEIALARAASRLDVPLVLSCAAGVPMEKVVRDGGAGSKWFQLYISGDRALSLATLERAQAAGFGALVLTVDSIVNPNREFSLRSGYTIPPRFSPRVALEALTSPRWLLGTIGRYYLEGGLPGMSNYPLPDTLDALARIPLKDDTIDWRTLQEIRAAWPRKLVVKGVLDPRDALTCAECGVDAIIVSNHGGLVLDGAMATIDALPDIVDAVGEQAEVYIDGGIRRGSDIVKALALGAKAAFVGRATLYALAAFGEAGVVRALELLRDEIDRTLASLGCPRLADLSRDHVVRPPG